MSDRLERAGHEIVSLCHPFERSNKALLLFRCH